MSQSNIHTRPSRRSRPTPPGPAALLLLGCCLAGGLMAATAAEEDGQTVEEAGLPYADGRIRAYFSEGHKGRALDARPLVEEAMEFYQAALGVESRMAIAVLAENDWQRFAQGIPYGLPFVADADPPVAFIPATGDGVLVKGVGYLRSQASTVTLERIAKTGLSFDEGAMAFVDAIVLHELGHVQTDAYGIQPASKWFAEFLASYFAYGFLREKHSDLANLFELYAYRLNQDAPGPEVRTLARFEAEYARLDANDYAWYQGMFLGLVMRLHEPWGTKLLAAARRQFPVADAKAMADSASNTSPFDLEQELEVLDGISPEFRAWAAELQMLEKP